MLPGTTIHLFSLHKMGGVGQHDYSSLLLKRCAQDVVCKRDEEGKKLEDTVPLFQPIVDAIVGKYTVKFYFYPSKLCRIQFWGTGGGVISYIC